MTRISLVANAECLVVRNYRRLRFCQLTSIVCITNLYIVLYLLTYCIIIKHVFVPSSRWRLTFLQHGRYYRYRYRSCID